MECTIVVTRFPLFENSFVDVSGTAEISGTRRSLTFMSSEQEGIYFAGLRQIGKLIPNEKKLAQEFGEREADGSVQQMPNWMAVASGGNFWPVARLGKVESLPDPKRQRYLVTAVPQESLPRLWSVSISIAMLCACVHLLLILAGGPCRKRMRCSEIPWIQTLATHRMLTFYLSPREGRKITECGLRREFGRELWITYATVQIALILSYLLWPAIIYVAGESHSDGCICLVTRFVSTTTVG